MQGENVTYQIASDANSRGNFTRNGVLDGQQDPNPRAIDDTFGVFAISRDLGTIQATQDPVVWTVGYTTDPVINYTDLSGAPPISRSLYYKTQYSNDSDEPLASIDSNYLGRWIGLTLWFRLLTFLTILAMRPLGLNSWTRRYFRMPALSRVLLETWSLLQSPKYTAACS